MAFLYWLESLRTPFLDAFFAAVTQLGDETLFIAAGLLVFWCVNKKYGYYLLTVGFAGTLLNQFLKLTFRIPRPWVKDPNFTIVESAREAASGYSFPSGHTATAVGVFGGIARFRKEKPLRVICVVLIALVSLSRMYLGVHTPLDVGVSLAIGIVLVLLLYPVVNWAMQSPQKMRWFFSAMLVLSVAYLLFVSLFPFPENIDAHNWESGIKNAYKILGCMLALWLTYEVDTRFIRFETHGVWWAQLLKLALGIAPILLIKSGLKAPLNALFQGHYAADAVRYFLLTAFAGCVWPLTFRFFARLGTKKENA